MSHYYSLKEEIPRIHPKTLHNGELETWSRTIARILPHWAALWREHHDSADEREMETVTRTNRAYIDSVFSTFSAQFPNLKLPNPTSEVQITELTWADICNADPPSALEIMQHFRLRTPLKYGQVNGEYLSLKAALQRLLDLKIKIAKSSHSYGVAIYPDFDNNLKIEITHEKPGLLRKALQDPVLVYLVSRLSGEIRLGDESPTPEKLEIVLPTGYQKNQALSNADQQEESYLQEIYHRICTWVDQERAYLKNRLTIADVSEALSIGEKQISRSINLFSGQNFQAFINRYRIAEAKRLLLDQNQRYSHLGIAMESGFGSKSAFYSAFKSTTGITPKAFVERAGNHFQNRKTKTKRSKNKI